MWSAPRSAKARRRHAGFTVIELMIGVVIGLLASLAVTHVLVNWEGQKRTATLGSDAQINGALALSTLERGLMSAGYGFAATPSVIGCTITATFNGAPVANTAPNFPTALVPVQITQGVPAGAPDSIRILASGKSSYSIPLRIVAPGYTQGGNTFSVTSVRGIALGDLVIASQTTTAPPTAACEMFQVSANSGSTPVVTRNDDSYWNLHNNPANTYTDGGALFNMGTFSDATYSISANGSMLVQQLALDPTTSAPSYPAAAELFPNIVQLQALYGKDTNGDGVVDTWDTVTPTTNAGWLQVIAVRVAVVARSAQYEKDVVTNADISWDVGNAGTVAGSTTCGTSKCVTITINNLTDWKHYRYKLFETVVPLRNLLWNS